MKKFLAFIFAGMVCMFNAGAVTRSEKPQNRAKTSITTATEKNARTIATTKSSTSNISRSSQTIQNPIIRKSDTRQQRNVASRTPTARTTVTRTSFTKPQQNVVPRAATNTQQESSIETQTGIEYEKCKSSFFACMDQFCAMKNDNFKRCSCSDRVYDFQTTYDTYQRANENLTEFTENLDVVGMTYDQAIAMKTASEGEDALTEDKSASKQLLQAIMNAIKGDDASVGGKYKDLNSVKLSSDITNAFGLDNSGQIIASYNGTTLYKSVFPTCKSVASENCKKASLQRAVNAYLMAIEQDCNTVEVALKNQQKSLKASTHETSAMLDLARVENRKKHNSDDIATCITNIEHAITSDEVCGENYHKCLDYGQFIDVSTGAPLTGVVDFYKLGKLLTFNTAENLEKQKLSSIPDNRKFVEFFENKTKKFAQTSLNKCTENADTVWKEYLDMALIDIYYAQQSKVTSIEQNCVDLITACYNNQNTAIANAMANLMGDKSILLKPAAIDLTNTLCSNYIESCNNMFDGDVIKMYIANQKSTDSENACRAVAQQCFDKFGGTGYENFYTPQSGLFTNGAALDWFSLYDDNNNIVSPCAQELVATEGCNNDELLAKVFGGFDKHEINGKTSYTVDTNDNRIIRPRGVASEVYTKIINNLSTQCEDINGYFLEYQYAIQYGYNTTNFCQINTSDPTSEFYINPVYNSDRNLHYWYKFIENENMCPANYASNVDTQSWGVCSCWENGGYRSQNGTTPICRPLLPVTGVYDGSLPTCSKTLVDNNLESPTPVNTQWCQQAIISSLSQVCPRMELYSMQGTSYILCAQMNNHKKSIIMPVLEHMRQRNATESEISVIVRQAILEMQDESQVSTH